MLVILKETLVFKLTLTEVLVILTVMLVILTSTLVFILTVPTEVAGLYHRTYVLF
jgi:hypothetical protein